MDEVIRGFVGFAIFAGIFSLIAHLFASFASKTKAPMRPEPLEDYVEPEPEVSYQTYVEALDSGVDIGIDPDVELKYLDTLELEMELELKKLDTLALEMELELTNRKKEELYKTARRIAQHQMDEHVESTEPKLTDKRKFELSEAASNRHRVALSQENNATSNKRPTLKLKSIPAPRQPLFDCAPSNPTPRVAYTAHCWNCKKGTLDEREQEKCRSCGWLVCVCGACKDPKHGGCKKFMPRASRQLAPTPSLWKPTPWESEDSDYFEESSADYADFEDTYNAAREEEDFASDSSGDWEDISDGVYNEPD